MVVTKGNSSKAVVSLLLSDPDVLEMEFPVSIKFLPRPKLKLNWRVVGAQTETKLKEKKLRIEDALNATKVGTDIVKRALSYPLKLIAKNTGVN
ncbi:hypothetical protein Droror1_Dr00021855 [Drosera rotundifolia]